MRVPSRVVAGAVFVALAAFAASVLAQSPDPWIGTWKVNIAKSKYSPGPAPKSSMVTIVAAPGGFKQTNDTVPATGAPTHTEVTATLDGKDHPVAGNPNADMQAYTKIDGHSYQVVAKKAGKVTISTRVVVSADGKMRTATQTGTDAQGKAVSNTIVSEKQ